MSTKQTACTPFLTTSSTRLPAACTLLLPTKQNVTSSCTSRTVANGATHLHQHITITIALLPHQLQQLTPKQTQHQCSVQEQRSVT
jgi:hypothetical protein